MGMLTAVKTPLTGTKGVLTGTKTLLTGTKGVLTATKTLLTGTKTPLTATNRAMVGANGAPTAVKRAHARLRARLAVACLATLPAAAWGQIQVHTIVGSLESNYTDVVAVSADGRVAVGATQTPDSPGSTAFRWTPVQGAQSLLSGNDWANLHVRSVSADGSVAVCSAHRPPWGSYALRWTAETGVEDLGLPPGEGWDVAVATRASADGGVVAGFGARPASNEERIFRWTRETGMVDLGIGPGRFSRILSLSADGREMFGAAGPARDIKDQAFRWTAESGFVSLGPVAPAGLSPRIEFVTPGLVVAGTLSPTPGLYRPFRWTAEGGLEIIDVFGLDAQLTGISDDGSVISGIYFPGPGFESSRPFIWTARGGAVDFERLLTDRGLSFGNRVLGNTLGVSADGRSFFGLTIERPVSASAFVATFPCAVDRNLDGIADFFDYFWFVEDFETAAPAADFNNDGFVDFFDYDAFVGAFEAGC